MIGIKNTIKLDGRPTRTNQNKKTFTLFDNENGNSYEIPTFEGTIGPNVLDITNLYKETGLFTYDPGFTSTASCKSKITYIDGEEGVLLYRGYPIDQLAEKGNYLETCYLLLNGELPTQEEYNKFEETINEYALVHEQLNRFFTGFRPDAHPLSLIHI